MSIHKYTWHVLAYADDIVLTLGSFHCKRHAFLWAMEWLRQIGRRDFPNTILEVHGPFFSKTLYLRRQAAPAPREPLEYDPERRVLRAVDPDSWFSYVYPAGMYIDMNVPAGNVRLTGISEHEDLP